MISIVTAIIFSTTALLAFPQQANATASANPLFRLASLAYERFKIDCPALPPRKFAPKSASDLRIDDIAIVGALGDSITAGWFAKGTNGSQWPEHPTSFSLDLLREDRGVSWVAGGEKGAITVPNLIKRFNPDLMGQSYGTHGPNICYGLICPPILTEYVPDYDHLNMARSGSLYENLPNQAKLLVAQMKKMHNFKDDWKLVNIFIGSNDACRSCSDFLENPESFEATMRSVIDTLRDNIPKLVLNIHQQFNVTQVYTLTKDQPYCATIRARGLSVECKCAFREDAGADLLRDYMDLTVARFNAKLEKIQRYYEKLLAPKDDFMVLAFIDCNNSISLISCFPLF